MSVSQLEQWLLELINRIRLDPVGMTQDFGIDLNAGLPPGTISGTPKQPLAMSALLDATSEFHGAWVLANNSFGTIGHLGSSPGDRMAYAGFNGGAPFDWSEAIGWRDYALGANVHEPTVAELIARDMLLDPAIRQAILADDYNETGIAFVGGQIADLDRKASVLIQDLGDSDAVFITGGVFASNNLRVHWSNQPVGAAGVEVTNGTASMTTGTSGGYALEVEAGRHSVRLGSAHVGVTVDDENVKLDFVGNRGILSSHSVTIYSGAAYATLLGISDATLAAGNNAGAIWLEGNTGDNRLSGNSSSNILDGREGDDFMQGGAGDDLYYVDSIGDKVNEFTGGGFDRVETTSSFSLSLNSEVELIKARFDILWDLIDLSGNRFAQEIRGNYGANRIDGGGGGDLMVGLDGDDVYIVRDSTDRVIEYEGHGRDVVKAGVNYTLAGNAEVERLETRLPSSGHTIALTGNDFVQTITGNAGRNTLSGMGGDDSLIGAAGNDTLIGGMGADALHGGTGVDTYVFNSVAESARGGARDSVYGWESHDRIDLSAIDGSPLADGRQALTYAGQVAYGATLALGELAWYQRGSSTYVIANTEGDGQAEFELRLSGLHSLVANDFLL